MKLITLALLLCGTALGQSTGVTTRAYDNARSGWNPHETTLSQGSIIARGIRRLTIIPVVGDARGMEAQPLILPAVPMPKGSPNGTSTEDIMVLPSMANVIRGVNAETGAGIWQATLDMPVLSTDQIDEFMINQHFGCMSTGVIDPDTARLYQVCGVSVDKSGTPKSGRYFLYVLRVSDGSQVVPPIPIQGTDTKMWKQRASLLLTNVNGVKTVFFAHGSVYETSTGITGGIQAFDVTSNKLVTQILLPEGIWMAGQGLTADASGQIYALTANGDFDPTQGWYGESLIKLQYTKGTASLKVIDQWSPWTDYARAGLPVPAGKQAGVSLPTETMKPVGGKMSMSMQGATVVGTMNSNGQPMAIVYPPDPQSDWADEDWGSSGPACILAINVCVAAGKDGIGYPISMTHLGSTTAATVGTPTNYAKLAAPCAWITMDPGPISCSPPNPTDLNFFPWGDSAHLHMTPVQLYDPLLKSWVIFVWGENSQLHKWAVGPTGQLTYIAQSHEYASADVRGNPPGGMPGGFCTGSSNGQDPNSMLLYCSIPYGDANAKIVNGRLLVYDPIHLAADGSLKVLWDSQRWGIPYVFNKFMPPTVWNGHVYLPNYNGGVDVYE
jgi:hypothetical protein